MRYFAASRKAATAFCNVVAVQLRISGTASRY
jgi:hypothetical protein